MNDFFTSAMIFITLLLSWDAASNSIEVHKHLHELACALKHEPLCASHANLEP